MTQCDYDGCTEPMRFRAYASYNADEGDNVHPRHARYPMPMIRACPAHIGHLMLHDADCFGSTRQWLIVLPRIDGDA